MEKRTESNNIRFSGKDPSDTIYKDQPQSSEIPCTICYSVIQTGSSGKFVLDEMRAMSPKAWVQYNVVLTPNSILLFHLST